MAQAAYDTQYGDKLINDSADITFDCPKCGFKSISRSRKARQLSKPYTCPKCGFIGP